MLKPGTPTTKINIGANGAVTATQTSGKINAGNYGTAVAYLNVSAHSGTTPTLDVKFQDSPSGVAGSWVDVPSGAFTQVTTSNTSQRLVLTSVGPYLQAVQTLGGTTPSYTYDLSVSGVN
jgi:hypothetical protein